jgi:beta-lactamase superfamily II metal-dependent hydrolase
MAAAKKALPRMGARRSARGGARTNEAFPGNAPSLVPPHGSAGIRVRMFRVGFGDFFVLSVPAAGGSKHILIDCGVHATDLKTIRTAVQQMAQDCNFHLSLVIMTHRHADHISGFGTCSDVFKQITVDRVWMPWFESRSNKTALSFQASLTSLATRLAMRLAERNDERSLELARMVDNMTGGFNAAGVAVNQKALDVLHGGFKNKVKPDYYKAGDTANLPDDLIQAGLTAEILGPPVDPKMIAQMNRKSQQYLAGDTDTEDETARLFSKAFECSEKDYQGGALNSFDAHEIKVLIDRAQPDVLAARAAAADKTLNNQSLVVLFGFAGKLLLFAGDAQWGNWENFLYGGAYGSSGHTELTPKAKAILNKIDFYKVGHHGSTNATPKDAVAAMRLGCAGMCSTQIDTYSGVPREPLLDALRVRMKGQLARSDQVRASTEVPANDKAGLLPSLFKEPTKMLFIDYEL